VAVAVLLVLLSPMKPATALLLSPVAVASLSVL